MGGRRSGRILLRSTPLRVCKNRVVPPEEPSKPRTRRPLWRALAVLGVFTLLPLGLPLTHPLFPPQAEAGCTVSDNHLSSARRSASPARIATDCGMFTSRKQVTCEADPSLKVLFIPGTSYDLVVRGPQIPLISSPTVVSAQVSSEQAPNPRRLRLDDSPNTNDPELNAKLQELADQYSPETLRAFDYEQPPFEPACDVSRHVMTSIGLQQMVPSRAEELLQAPEGVIPRSPKLPCEGFFCTRSEFS